MPPRKPTLPFGFTSLAPFNPSDDQWKNVETYCGFAIPPDLRLHACTASGNIRLSTIDATKADAAVGACRFGGYRATVHLRAHYARKTRQQKQGHSRANAS
jgi:hypothetical protein